jgi:EmrB/QacA subfamily drug resistance transporter
MNQPSKRTALVIAALSSFLTPFMASSINIALPSIGRDLAMDAVSLSWVATTYSLAAAMFLVPFGRLADIVGRKKIYLAGIVVYMVTTFFNGISHSGNALIIFRALEGIGAAMIFGTGTAILTSVFPPGERGRALGLNVSATYLGLSLGPFLGGLITQYLGWRSIFFCSLPLGALVLILGLWKLHGEWAEAKGERFDLTGSILYALSLVLVMYGLSRLPAPLGGALIGAGLIGLVIFVILESRLTSPVLNVQLFRQSAVFTLSNLAALINYSATSASGFLLSLYLQNVMGLTPQSAGVVMISQPIMQAIFSPLAGKLSDRVEPRFVASAGMGLTVVGLFLLRAIGASTPLIYVIGCLILLGLGFALFSSPNTNAVMSCVERKCYGVASATLGTMRLIGNMLSLGIASLTFALIIGRVQITPEVTPLFIQSARTIYSIFTVLCLLGVLASLARGKVRPATASQ